ncbi:hypothetical protein SLS55_001752 [Diplodia seriata]|uniref:Arginine metabolism regulation protein II n=1 Tax=Diplodia seriata TaxID=420778 RepID=A0ABR3CTC0_9PEZI
MDATVGPCSRVEKERLVMSDDLRTSMRRTPAGRVIAKLDGQSQQLESSERTDAVVHGPFAVFKLPPPASSGTLLEANEENQFLSEFLPDIDMIPDVVDFGDEQFVAALSAIDQMFDPEQQPYPDETEQCDQGPSTPGNSTGSFLTPYLNPYPESMAHQDASLLLNHYKTHVIRLLSPLKYQRKTPWNILQLPCAMTTLAELTMGYRTNHARASVFYGVMSISAFNLSASSTSTAKAHWNGIASSYRLQAHESLKASLEHEMSAQKKAKYKEMLMAILCMVTISAFSGAVENTRAYLLDAERLIRLRGLTKPRISRKIRLLHHCYAYIRLMHETTSPISSSSSSSTASSFRITDWQSSPCSSSPASSPANDTTDDDDDEHSLSREKSFDLGVHDLHLAIPGDFAKHTLYPDVYGIPESLMQLISQTTRLGNERDAMMNSNNPNPTTPPSSPARFFRRAKAVERAIFRLQREDDDDEHQSDGRTADADPSAVASNRRALAHLRRALRSALAVYFYRRVHDVADASVLQNGVERTIEHLEAVQREDEEQAARGRGKEEGGYYTTGIVWPGFVAACEAEGAELRERFERWFEVQEGKSGMPTFGRAREVVTSVLWS